MKVRFTGPARADLEAIRAYISEDSPRAADHVVSALVRRAEALADFPYTGRQTDEPEVRVAVLPRFRYLIFYRVAGDELHILHVRHTSQRPREEVKRRL